MSVYATPTQESTDVEQKLEAVATGRTTVQRVLEYVRGERAAADVKPADWIDAVNHVRRDLDETLVLLRESDEAITAISTGDCGSISRITVSETFGKSESYESRRSATDYLSDGEVEILEREDAKQRFQVVGKEIAREQQSNNDQKVMTDGGQDVVKIRKKDTSSSTKDYWRNGAGDHPYHRHDDPCEDAPEHGYVHYESSKVHSFEGVDICPNCDWSGTELSQNVDVDTEQSDLGQYEDSDTELSGDDREVMTDGGQDIPTTDTEQDYTIRIVGNPDGEQYDEHEVIPFESRERLENFSNVIGRRGIDHTKQVPKEEAEQEVATDGGSVPECPECGGVGHPLSTDEMTWNECKDCGNSWGCWGTDIEHDDKRIMTDGGRDVTSQRTSQCSSCGASYSGTLSRFHGDGGCPYCGGAL